MLMMLSRVLPGVRCAPRPRRASTSSGSPSAAKRSPWLSRRVSRSWTRWSNSLTSSRPTAFTRRGILLGDELDQGLDRDWGLRCLLAEQVDRLAQDRQAGLVAIAIGIVHHPGESGGGELGGLLAFVGRQRAQAGRDGRDRQRPAVGPARREQGNVHRGAQPRGIARPASPSSPSRSPMSGRA